MHNVISPNVLRTRCIQRWYKCARRVADPWADGAYANYGIYIGTMTSYRNVSLLFPLLPIIPGFKKFPIILKRIPA
jgi:hypothetical protein